MINGYFATDSARIRKTADNLEQQLNAIVAARRKITEKLDEIKTMWEGPTKEVFFAQVEGENIECINLCNSLNEAIQNLYSAASDYEASDNRARSAVDAIKV